MVEVDLTELATRESEQVEWKQGPADIDEVVERVVAFANDLANLGGGYVVCGASELRDEHGFQRVELTGLTALRFREVEEQVLARCRDFVDPPLTPIIAEVPTVDPARRVLVFITPRSSRAHLFRRKTDTGKYYVRVGRNTVQARNGLLRELLVRKGEMEPWDLRPCQGATVEDLDLIALRDALQRMGSFDPSRGLDPFLSDQNRVHALTPTLCVRDPLQGHLRPRNFAMLLFGRDLQRYVPGAYSIFSVYPGADRSEPHAERHEIPGNLLEQERRLTELLNTQAFTVFDKQDLKTPNAVKYPQKALKEAMINALAHRDYASVDPLRITVFSDRIEVVSPGALPFGVRLEDLRAGRATAKWRNQSLAWFFNRLQLAQAEGQGISTILREMRNEGCPAPTFDANEDRMTCVLPAHPRHAVLRELQRVEQALVLGRLDEAQQTVLGLLEHDPFNYRVVQLFCDVQRAARDFVPILRFVQRHQPELQRFSASALVSLADALRFLHGEGAAEAQRLARQLLTLSAAGRFEVAEIRVIAVAMMELDQDQEALGVLDRALSDHAEWRAHPALLQLRGRALLQLAKRCSHNARSAALVPRLKARAWDECRRYLDEAERDLRAALEQGPDPVVRQHIDAGLDFVQTLRRIAGRPRPRGRG